VKKLTLVIIGIITSLFLAGCETSKGIGRDMERAGEKIQDASRDAQSNL
jgi:predicted small secreted protein